MGRYSEKEMFGVFLVAIFFVSSFIYVALNGVSFSGYDPAVDAVVSADEGQSSYLWLFVVVAVLSLIAIPLLLFVLRQPRNTSMKKEAPVKTESLPRQSSLPQSLEEYYQNFKVLKELSVRGTETQKAQASAYLKQLRTLLLQGWLITGTKMVYQPDSDDADIVMALGARRVRVPIYSHQLLSHCSDDPQCLRYLQSVFGTNDSYDTLVSTLEFVASAPRSKIMLSTPDQSSRQVEPVRRVGLGFNRMFTISASGLDN